MTNLVDEVKRRTKPPKPRYAKAVRINAGVSQERLAAELGVHRITVARWESGTRVPRGELLEHYVDLLADLQRLVS